MAKTAISSDVKAANSKLAQFLRRREEEEMILQIGKRKPKQICEEKLPGGSGRWMLEPDYRAPTPLIDRPRTLQGATSFHFSYISISKEALPTVNGSPIQGVFGRAKNAALEHSKYIERDGAAERSAGAQHAAYVERENAVEGIDPSALMAEAIERQIASVINETPTESEAQILGLVDAIPDGIPSVFSNISDDPFLRQEFWRAAERIEATPRSHQIILDPEISPAWWANLEPTNLLDPEFKHHAMMVAESYRQHIALPVAEGKVRAPFAAKPYPVSAERAGKLIQQSQRMDGYNDYSPPFEFKSGRGGRVQFRLVAELPHELTAEDRALIVQNFCDHLGTLEDRVNPDGSKEKIGMMYTAVVHAPDAHNDSRNYHLHVVAYDRPAKFMDELNQWDFEVREVYQDPGSRKDRVRYPLRQNKIGQVSQGSAKTGVENSGVDFIPGLRRKFATITNSVLKARGVQRKLDPRKYTEMGIDRTPTDHLGTKAAALEAIGVPTAVGQLNALAIWGDAERAIRRDAAKAGRTYQTSQTDLEHLAKAIFTIDPAHASLPEFRTILDERGRLVADLASDREEVMAFDNMEAKAKSRAIRTRQTCIQFLAEIEAGNADRNTRIMRSVIEDRFKGAQAHINQIDEALAPHRQVLADAARNIEKREARCAEIDAALQPIVATLKDRAQKYGIGNVLAAMEQAERQSKDKADEQTAGQPKVPNPDIQFDGKTLTIEALNAHIANDEARAESASADISQPSVPLQPMSIGGLPIVVPTIAPRKEHSDAERVDNHSTPDGLSPLRPEPDRVLSDLPREVIATNIDAPAETPRGSEAMAEGGLPLPSTPQPILETGQSALEKPVVQRRKPVDPALFDLPVQEPPIKPETTTADYSDWDELVNRVAANRIPVKAEKLPSGEMKFTVPSLSPEENALLHARRFSRRVGGRLAAIYERQQQEIQRLHRWIKSQGQDPGSLLLIRRSASLGGEVQSAVRTLFRHWGAHASVIGAIREENDRRIELAKAIANQPIPEPKPADLGIEMRKAHAARSYPQPDQAYTVEVRDFLRLLHEAAPAEDIQAAADKIHADPYAREDIYKHTIELAVTYRGYVEGADQRLLEWHRDDHRGR